jgi:prolyl oligopeptidase
LARGRWFVARWLGLGATVGLGLLVAGAVSDPPATRTKTVTDDYHGVQVAEEYRWLEDTNDPEVKDWVQGQNTRTQAYLDALPARSALRRRLQRAYQESSPRYSDLRQEGGTLFARKVQPPKEQPLLVALGPAADPASGRVIVDPSARSAKDTLSMDWYVPSHDGKKVAVALSAGGSEDADLHILDTLTGEELEAPIPRVNFPTAGGSAAWTADGSTIYYTRYPQGNERPPQDRGFYQQVWRHRLGTPASADAYVIGNEFPRIAEIQLESRDGKSLLVSVANGDGGEFAHYLLGADGTWTQVTRFEDHVVSATLGPDEALYLVSRKDAPRGKVLRLPIARPRLAAAEIIVAEGEVSIEPPLTVSQSGLYVPRVAGGPSQVDIYDHRGKPLGGLPLPPISSVDAVVGSDRGAVLYGSETFLDPPGWYRFAGSGSPVRTALSTKSPLRFDDTEVVREFAVSRDGTRVPLNIIRRKGIRLDGQNPTLLTAYGGYGISLAPSFVGNGGRIWLDGGGLYVVANLRGGGEYGEAWHQAGRLTRKQNVFDDFAACAKHLIDRGYTSPPRLAIEGGSNGGLLMGAALTQQPQLFRAVVSYVGIYDMVRVERDPNGTFNVTEYGSVHDPEQFRALYAYSPYHHVTDGTAYPAVFLLTGDNDGRVNPAHSRKMTARLQAATSSGRPILLRTTASAGHGFGTAASERIEQEADVFAFLFDQLGMRYEDKAP